MKKTGKKISLCLQEKETVEIGELFFLHTENKLNKSFFDKTQDLCYASAIMLFPF